MIKKLSRYEIIREIGRGGMAVVYLAHDPHFERRVVIKVLTIDPTVDSTLKDRFRREAKTIAALEHPAIVPVYDYGEENNRLFIVMRYMTGGSLADRLRQQMLTLDQAAMILDRICSALDASHQNGIIHRDLKPSNILFDKLGHAYLADFGIARSVENTGTQLTADDKMIGTPGYMSPEQIRGEKLDNRSDIYALGAVVYEMLTGKAPFEADSAAMALVKQMTATVPSPRRVRPEIPQQIDSVVMRALEKDRQQRPGTASEIADLLRSAATSNLKASELLEKIIAPEQEGLQTGTQEFENPDLATKISPAEQTSAGEEPRSRMGSTPIPKKGVNVFYAVGGISLVALLMVGGWWFFLRPQDPVSPPPPPVVEIEEAEITIEPPEQSADEEVTLPEPSDNRAVEALPLPAGIYDNFSEDQINPLRFELSGTEICEYGVENGELIIRSEAQDEELPCGWLLLNAPVAISGQDYGAFSGQFWVDFAPPAQEGFTGLVLFHEFYDGSSYQGSFTFSCGVGVVRGQPNITFIVNDDRPDSGFADSTRAFQEKPIFPQTWYELQLQVDEAHRRVTCTVEGRPVGEWIIEDLDEFDQFKLHREIRSWRLPRTAMEIRIDDLGWVSRDQFSPPDEAILYDDFSTNQLDDLRWSIRGEDGCGVAVKNGVGIVSSEVISGLPHCEGLVLNAPPTVAGWRLGELQAQMQINVGGNISQEGGSGLMLAAEIYDERGNYLGNYDVVCMLNVIEDRPFASFVAYDTRLGEDSNDVTLAYEEKSIETDTWYDLKVGRNPEKESFYCTLNDTLVAEFRPDNDAEINGFHFRREILHQRKPDAEMSAFFDDVKWVYPEN